MTFKLSINCDNAAFEDDASTEIARILRETAEKLENGREDGRCVDYNGNVVGSFKFSGRKEVA